MRPFVTRKRTKKSTSDPTASPLIANSYRTPTNQMIVRPSLPLWWEERVQKALDDIVDISVPVTPELKLAVQIELVLP